ncbi:ArnT family glycosyltransferase [Streptomyces sp. NPDC048419]|uniref:ArnT family glycosyltransferase n=1 Tax=Streptomyces sp. NPDC048419 TaxID=3365547 RepID=UPI0037211F09
MTDLSVQSRIIEQPMPPSSGHESRKGSDAQHVKVSLAPNRRNLWFCRAILLCILLVQTVLSLRLTNTAFEDEALYLYAGHLHLDHLINGAPYHGEFTQYFSGSPLLYPVLAALIDSVCGLAGARALSLVFMLGATALLYSLSRLLFQERAALCTAAVFSVTQSTLTLGNLATHDAPVIFLLALASWIVVQSADSRSPLLCLIAAPVLALSVAVKYAALVYVPVVLLIAAFVVFRHCGRRQLILCGLLLPTTTGAILLCALRVVSASYLEGLKRTTTERERGTASVIDLLSDSALWGGLMVALALLGTILYAKQGCVRKAASDSTEGLPSRLWRLAFGLTLTSAAFLAPLYQMHLHTETSLHKHIGYGLLFAAPMAGVALTRLAGARFRQLYAVISIWVVLLMMGVAQAQSRYYSWPDSSGLVAFLEPLLTRNGHYLLETRWPATYYLRNESDPQQWASTYYINYTDPRGAVHKGDDGYKAAIRNGYFDIVVLTNTTTKARSDKIGQQLDSSKNYRFLSQLSMGDHFPSSRYRIWVKRRSPVKRGK